jgi:hypothetical protein
MTSRLRSRPFVVTAASAAAIFVAVLVLLAVRMADGQDPALGARTSQQSPSVTHAQAPVVPEQTYETDEDPYGDEEYGYDDGAATQQAPQGAYDDQSGATAQPQAPLQSGTS